MIRAILSCQLFARRCFLDMRGIKTQRELARRGLLEKDVFLSFLPSTKRRRMSSDLLHVAEEHQHFKVCVEVTLLSKCAHVQHPKGLRPI